MFSIYTGGGKGKTTSAIGLIIRAIGASKKIALIQFLKPDKSAEESILKTLNVKIKRFGKTGFIITKPKKEDIKEARRAINYINKIIDNNETDLLVLDEINLAIYFKLISIEDAKEIINKCKEKNIELVFTGRNASKELIKIADLVSEIKEIKHYYNKGIKARIGFEY